MSAATNESGRATVSFDAERARRDFPILQQPSHGQRLVFLDSAASAQKPRQVIDAMADCFEHEYANIHRGVYELSAKATAMFERVREATRAFLGAAESREIVFTRNTTESINLVAASYGRQHVHAGDEVVITEMEHHSNIVPWQILCEQTGATLRVAPIDDDGALRMDTFETLLGPRTKIVAVAHISNSLGTVNPVARICELAHAHGAVVLVDGAQAVPHQRVDVREIDCDFYAFSGHKLFGPGVGVLYGRASVLSEMPPYQSGGGMIRSVTFEKTTYEDIPMRFEAGTPDIGGVRGLGAALDYVNALDLDAIAVHEADLLEYGIAALTSVPGLRLIGTAADRVAVISFLLEGVHPHDIGTVLDQNGIAVRSGHHCAQPVMDRFAVPATVRASFALYNTREDVDALVAGLGEVRELFT
jgi:cysteine desulfurase/selenocysteine lyase